MPGYSAVFKPKSGRFGVHPAFLASIQASTLTASTTTSFRIPTPKRRLRVLRGTYCAHTLPIDADGTVLATLKKYDISAAAAVSLSSAVSLKVDVSVADTATAFTLLTTLTEAQLTVDEGDTLFVDVVSNSAAIDTQPVDLQFVVEVGVKE